MLADSSASSPSGSSTSSATGWALFHFFVQLADRANELLRIRVGVQRGFTLWRKGPDAFVLTSQPALTGATVLKRTIFSKRRPPVS